MRQIGLVANRFDFATLTVWDDLGDPPPWQMLVELARQPGNARIGPACLALPKYAALDGVVGEMTTLSRLRPGHVFLGLTSGAWLDKVGLGPASVRQVREAIEVCRHLLERRSTSYEGSFYKISPGFALNYETPPGPIPVMIGAWGERMSALAGEVADEVKAGGSANPAVAMLLRERVIAGAARAGRRVEEVGLVLGAVTVVDEDRELALSIARLKCAPYLAAIGHRDPEVESHFADVLAAVKTAVEQDELHAAAAAIPDALLRRFAFAGTPNDVIEQAEALFAAGATRIEFGSPHGLDELTGIELLGTRVLPHFAR